MAQHSALNRRALLGLAAGVVAWPAQASSPMAREDAYLFGSPVQLMVPADTPMAVRAEVMRGLRAMHERWNAWKPGELSRLNAALRAGQVATTTPALVALIQGAARLETLSLGHFNAAIGASVRAWGFHADLLGDGPPPEASSLERLRASRPSVLQLEVRGLQVRSRNPAVQLDFGAYAKGVAIDWTLDRLRARGVAHALVNLGGNLAAMGLAGGEGGRHWRVGVRDPAGPGLVATLTTAGREAVVTSGSYERWRHADGQRVTHILDPRSAAPAPELVSVTVVHPDAGLADAAATALLVAGAQHWQPLAERMGLLQVLVIDRFGRQQATPALAARLEAPPRG